VEDFAEARLGGCWVGGTFRTFVSVCFQGPRLGEPFKNGGFFETVVMRPSREGFFDAGHWREFGARALDLGPALTNLSRKEARGC